MRHVLIAAMICACGDNLGAGDAATRDTHVEIDATGCMPPLFPDATPSAAPACTAGGIPGSCVDVTTCTGSRMSSAGLCAGPATIECCTPRFADSIACDPNVLPLPNACLVEEPGDVGCPTGMARAGAVCIDRFEAALDGWSPYANPHGHTARAVSLRGAVPQGYISQLDASAACVAAGKRLCSDAEWLRACRGPASTTYPYGDTRRPGTCNDARTVHPAVELYGTSDSWIFAHLDSPCLNQEANGLAPTGAHADCITAEGVFDMMGNLHEWTADPAGTFRGGFFVDTVLNGNGCLYTTTAHDTAYSDYSTGFRCCADPS